MIQEKKIHLQERKIILIKWIEDGILVRDEEPVIYMYEQTIEMYDTHYSNTSFVALVELEEIGKGAIMPCEKATRSFYA